MPSPKPKAASAASQFLGEALKPAKATDAFFHILPIPYAGERNKVSSMASAPDAIISASQHLETWDGRSVPAKHGIHTLDAIDCKGGVEKVLERISAASATIIKANKFPIGLGGDGTVTYALVKGLLDAGVEDFGVVQIDAHADLRDDDNGDSWSEACVMKRIVDEDVPLFQLGVRSLSKEEADARKVNGVVFYDADFLVSRNIHKVEMPNEFPDKVYLSIDIDGFDPSVFPTAGGMPGGLGWWQVLAIVESISQQCDIIGLDITDFCPQPEQPRYDQAAAQLLYRLMGIVERARL
ncbi:MAG: arginase family protein [Pseudomonadales bacterium]|nr:arginase family protein [Pseudomonadales bacterium]